MPNHFHGIIEILEINADDTGMLDDYDQAMDDHIEPATYAHGCVIDANERKINANNERTTDTRNGRTTDNHTKRATETNDRHKTDVRDQHTSGRPRRGAPTWAP